MKLLVLSHLFPNNTSPTFGVFVLRQLEQLAALGVELKVISPVPYSPKVFVRFHQKWQVYREIQTHTNFDQIEVYYPRYVRPPGKWFRPLSGTSYYYAIRGLIKTIRREFAFDAILANMLLPDGEAAMRLGRKEHVPTFCYAIGDDLNLYPSDGRVMYRKIKHALRGNSGIICHGNDLRNKLAEIAPGLRNVAIIYRGCDRTIFCPDPKKRRDGRRKLGISEDTVLCIFVGYLDESKGVAEIIAAFTEIFAQNQLVNLILIGAGKMRDELIHWRFGIGAEDRVHLAGIVAHHKLPEYLNAADLFVFPSHNEGIPNAVVEAASCGLPIIASRIPGVQEVVGEIGDDLLFQPKNHGDLHRQLNRAIASAVLRQEHGQQAQQRISQHFDAAKNAQKLVTFLAKSIKS